MLNLILKEFVDTLSQFDDYDISIFDRFESLIFFTKNCIKVNRDYFKKLTYDEFKLAKGVCENRKFLVAQIKLNGINEGYIMIEELSNNEEAIIKLLQKAIELRLKFQEAEYIENKFLSVSEKLVNKLINYSQKDEKSIVELFKAGKFQTKVPRILIILDVKSDCDMEYLANTSFYYDSQQDIVAQYEKFIIIFKACKYDVNNHYNQYKNYVDGYIEFIQENTVFDGNFYIGQPEFEYSKYNESYQRTRWLVDNKNILDNNSRNMYYFKDYIELYFIRSIPKSKYKGIFDPMLENIKNFDSQEFLMIWPVMIKNNYNIVKSSKDLYLHKNTLIYKIEKLKRQFNVDPINVESDRCFLKNLYYYILYEN